ncbi:MAG: hypothetical protein IPK08_19300 [Bacteroidetes bacterium]|nr:hypothetical protein [Bacteroidota bacterium]
MLDLSSGVYMLQVTGSMAFSKGSLVVEQSMRIVFSWLMIWLLCSQGCRSQVVSLPYFGNFEMD